MTRETANILIDIHSLLIDSLDTHIEIDSNVCHCSLTFLL